MRTVRVQPLLLVGLLLLPSCSLLNKLDVCERARPEEHVANVRTEGDQLVNGQTPLVVLPSGGAFLAFSSDESGSSSKKEIRGTFLDVSGERLPTCSQSSEITYAQGRDGADVSWATNPSVAPPGSGSTYGLIAFLRIEASDETFFDATSTVHAIPFDRFGCPVLDIGDVRIDESDGVMADFPAAVNLGPDRFAIVWTDQGRDDLSYRLRGRVLDTSGLVAAFPPTAPEGEPSGGAAVDLLPPGDIYSGVAARSLSDESFALAWTVGTFGGVLTTHLGIFNDRLVMTDGPFVLNPRSNANGSASSNQLALDFDGQQFLIAWTAADDDGRSRVYARFVDANGALLKGPGGTEVFRVGNSVASEEARPSVVALRGGGFLTAWEESGGDVGGREGARDLHAALFDATGERAFSNPACGTEPFELNSGADGNQENPFLARYPDGAIATVWTDRGSNDINQRGTSSVVSTVFSKESLFPIK